MKFFNTRIVTKTVQLDEAMKAKPKNRSLDEILADVKQQGQVKTASSSAQVKVAETAPEAKAEAAPKAEVKEAKKALPPEFLKNIKGKKGDEKDEDKKEKKDKDKDEKDAKCASSEKKTLKMASSLDFRKWAGEDVVRAWGQHGSHEKCVANVKDLVNEPVLYCKLLQVASGTAASIIKTANAKKAEKTSPKGVFKKLAKLSDEEAAFLKGYWRDLYGDAYVESMMKDY